MPDSSRRRDFVENGYEPEYEVDGIYDYEMVGNGAMVRIFAVQERRSITKLEYTVLATPEALIAMARQLEEMAAEAINMRAFAAELGTKLPGKGH